jgi:hypothetical protein
VQLLQLGGGSSVGVAADPSIASKLAGMYTVSFVLDMRLPEAHAGSLADDMECRAQLLGAAGPAR